MADKKPRTEIHLSPRGRAKWPHLNTPDEYEGVRKFKVDLILSAEDGAKLREKIEGEMPKAKALFEEAAKIAKGKGKKLKAPEEKLPFYEVIDGEEETGELAFRFSSGAEFTNKRTGETTKRTIPFFSASGKPLTGAAKPVLWGGSQLRIGFSMFPYYNAAASMVGISLRLEAVKVIEAVTGGDGANASRYGMADAEEGYEADEPTPGLPGDDAPAADGEDDYAGNGPAF